MTIKEQNNKHNGSLIHDRIKFVINILDFTIKKKVDDKTKVRLVNLISNEMEKTGIIETKILERLERIENYISKKPSKGDDKKHIKSKLHLPNETKSFLSLFNNSEGLKYLTHRFNGEKPEYNEFIEICKEEFDKGKKDYPNVPIQLLTRIEHFAFRKNPRWYIRKGLNIKDKIYPEKGWSEPTFVEWYKNPTNIHPGYDSKWNNEMIIPFKETIEVRAGNLTKIVNESIDFAFGNSKDSYIIDKDDKSLDTAEFYTDVDMFQQALIHIFSTIKEKSEKNFCFTLSIEFDNETLKGGIYKTIYITHIGSDATKNSNDPAFAKGDFNSIIDNLKRLCNYEVHANFPDGIRKRIFLTDDHKEYVTYCKPGISTPVMDESTIKGFTHILKFY